LTLFLISPSACKIYQYKLEAIHDSEFIYGFTYKGFTNGFNRQVASNLEGKVIPLSYRFARIFPLLEEHYIEKLKQAQIMHKELTAIKEEAKTKTQEWSNCLKLYVECEHMARATCTLHLT
jgi:hypothetical protein